MGLDIMGPYTINYKYIRFHNDQNDTLDAMIKPPYQKNQANFKILLSK